MILSRGHKLRYANQLVGAFILLVVGLLFVGMVVLIRSKDWWSPKVQLVAFLPDDELNGLQVNTPVQKLGKRVGKVTNITYETEKTEELRAWWPAFERPPTHFLRIDIEIAEEAIERLGPMTPQINVRRRMAGVGDVYLELMRGRELKDYYVIQPEKSAQDEIRTMTQLMGEVQRDFEIIRQSLERSSANFDESNADIIKTSERVRELSESLLEVAPKLPQIADSVERTSEDMRVTSERFRETTREISQSNRQMQTVLTDAQEVSPRLLPIAKQTEQLLQTSQVVADRLRDESEALPGTVNEFRDSIGGFQDTVGEAQEMIDGLRQNWLIRRHVAQPEQPSRVKPSKVRVGGFSP